MFVYSISLYVFFFVFANSELDYEGCNDHKLKILPLPLNVSNTCFTLLSSGVWVWRYCNCQGVIASEMQHRYPASKISQQGDKTKSIFVIFG